MKPTILDTFSGCGGLSLGAHDAGFETTAAIDVDSLLTSSFRYNFPRTSLLPLDIRQVDQATLEAIIPNGVDGIVGGPPCQAFSEMGRRDKGDPRRDLVVEFFRLVKLVRPKFFLFENVPGLAFDANIPILHTGLALLPASWKVFGPHILNAADFGAPTRRLRMFVFGFNTQEMKPPQESAFIKGVDERTDVRAAIADLATAVYDGVDELGFEFWKYDHRRSISEYAKGKRASSGRFTAHRKTAHTPPTAQRFAKLHQGETDKIGKYVRLKWDGLCPTLRAGTGSDRGSYQAVRPIHPVLDRVITPREAARLQGFPDSFVFHPTVWHSCRMIGNSVSPVLAKVLMQRIAQSLRGVEETNITLAAD